MEQLEIIPRIKILCEERKYEEARKLALKIAIHSISAKAYMLCCEHEKSYEKQQSKSK